jgi:hypothetical protein
LRPIRSFSWIARLRLFRRCTAWGPTWTGLTCILAITIGLIAAWLNYGESYLTITQRSPADILVVEGWIGRPAISGAVTEFRRGGYRLVVCTGGLTSGRWEETPASYAEMAARELVRLGVPETCILIATARVTESHRTFESAVAAWQTLQQAGIKPKGLNIFTVGAHARRSWLVFAKVNSDLENVGVIGWIPTEFQKEPWWQSSERSRELLEETSGYLYEVLLNSGRPSNSPRPTVTGTLQVK